MRDIKTFNHLCKNLPCVESVDNLGLFNGVMGLYIILLVQFDKGKYLISGKKAKFIYQQLLEMYPKLDTNDVALRLELLWCYGFLHKQDIAALPLNISDVISITLKSYDRYLSNFPVRIDIRQLNYLVGLTMLMFHHTEEENLNRYILEEQIIFRLNDCRKALSTMIPNVYSPKMLHAGLLHSILAFALNAKSHGIFPHRANEIISSISRRRVSSAVPLINDVIIINLLEDKPIQQLIKNRDLHSLASLLSYIGTYSLIYNLSALFEKALKNLNMIYPSIMRDIHVKLVGSPLLIGILHGLIQTGPNR